LALERIAASDLSPAAARTQGFFLEALRAFSPVLIAASGIELLPSDTQGIATDREPVLKAVQLGLSLVLFLSLVSVATVAALLSFVLLVSLARELSIHLSRIEARIPRPLRPFVDLLPWKAALPRP
jgi:hypothetical protein